MGRIVIIEDNPQNMKLAVFLLESAGHEVHRAKDAPSGIALIVDTCPDLVLMDIQLGGMDGLEATRVIKQDPRTSDIRIFALTAFAMKEDERKIRAAGCDGYIAKPIRHQDFLTRIAAALAERH